MRIRTLQLETRAWRDRNFPPEKRTALHQALGVAEESGELAHAVLKLDQEIRGGPMEHIAKAGDAMGDIVIYLCGLADNLGLDFEHEVMNAWNEVQKRDWVKNPQEGT